MTNIIRLLLLMWCGIPTGWWQCRSNVFCCDIRQEPRRVDGSFQKRWL